MCKEEPCYGTSATAVERTDENQPKYIRITDFDDFGIDANHVYMTTDAYSQKHVLENGDLLFARTGATVGKTYYYDGSIGTAIFAGYCIRFRFDRNKVFPKFVYWYTKTSAYHKWINGIQRPSGQPNINKEEYKSFKIILPKQNKQIELTAFLDSAINKRVKTMCQAEKALAELDDYIRKAIGMLEESPDKPQIFAIHGTEIANSRIDTEYHNPYYTKRVNEILKVKHDTLGNIISFSNETWNQHDIFPSRFPYIEIANVGLKENSYSVTIVPTNSAPSRAKMIVRNGDIIISTTRPNRGAIATISCPEGHIQIASTGFCVLRSIKRNDVSKEYLQWILLNEYVLQQMLQRSSGGNYPAIAAEELKKVVIPIPSLEVQQQICNEADKRKKLAEKIRHIAEQEWSAAKAQFEKELLEVNS